MPWQKIRRSTLSSNLPSCGHALQSPGKRYLFFVLCDYVSLDLKKKTEIASLRSAEFLLLISTINNKYVPSSPRWDLNPKNTFGNTVTRPIRPAVYCSARCDRIETCSWSPIKSNVKWICFNSGGGGSRDSVVDIATGYGLTTEWSEFESW
jgi:hypothetical protein